jgi:hypothetical protein
VAGPAAWWGEQWWRAILQQIRTSRVFVFLVSESWAQSKPCQAEYAYAKALGIPLLPVQVGDLASLRILLFGKLQMIDYRLASKDAFIVLLQSVVRLSAVAWTAPAPPPPEPDVPYEYLMRLGDRAAAASLPPEAQIDLLDQIRRALEVETDERARQDLVGLLATLRGRSDITFRTATEADNLVASLRGGGSRPHTGTVLAPPDSGGAPRWNQVGTGAATPRVFLTDAAQPLPGQPTPVAGPMGPGPIGQPTPAVRAPVLSVIAFILGSIGLLFVPILFGGGAVVCAVAGMSRKEKPAAVALAFSIVATIAGVIFGALVGMYASG